MPCSPSTHQRVDELPPWLPCTPHRQGRAAACRSGARATVRSIPAAMSSCLDKPGTPPGGTLGTWTCWAAALTLCQVHLVDEARQHVAILNVEVVVRPEDIGGDDSSEGAAMLLKIGPAEAPGLLLIPGHSHPPTLASHRCQHQTQEGCPPSQPHPPELQPSSPSPG